MGSLFDSIGSIPVVGDVFNELRGNPDEVKAAYDKAMGMSKQQTEQLKQFLMGQQQKTLGYYAPMQQMMQSAYGTKGLQAPTTPGVPGSTPLGGR